MSSLRDRLNRLKGNATAAEPSADMGMSAYSLDSPSENPPIAGPPPLTGYAGPDWERMNVERVETEYGDFLRRRRLYPASHRHGIYGFGQLAGKAQELQALLSDKSEWRAAHDRLLFIDTETTGLGVGTGNVPFMIGIGYFAQDVYCVEQLFIRHPGEEAAMLHYLSDLLAGFDCLVSYNGKTFDWPVIRNRFIMNRIRVDDRRLRHLDFLHPSRSLWKHTLESCRLGIVEEERLGIVRENDVPGSLAPVLYVRYLAEQRPELLQGVFEHNEKDVMTLAALAVHLSLAAAGELRLDGMDSEEVLRLAMWMDKIGNAEQAERTMEHLAGREDERIRHQLVPLAALYKRKGNWPQAVRLWRRYEQMQADGRLASSEPYIELAMYYEHKVKQYDVALHYARLALDIACRRRTLVRAAGCGGSDDERQRLEKRIGRLREKIARLKPKWNEQIDLFTEEHSI